MKIVETLEKLSNACGVAGREEEVRNLMKKFLKPHVDEIREDKLVNVIGIKRGKKKAPKVILAAHMDEIGLPVKTILMEDFSQSESFLSKTVLKQIWILLLLWFKA